MKMNEDFKMSIAIEISDGEFWFNINGNAVAVSMPQRSEYKSDQEWKKVFIKELKAVCAEDFFDEIKDNLE